MYTTTLRDEVVVVQGNELRADMQLNQLGVYSHLGRTNTCTILPLDPNAALWTRYLVGHMSNRLNPSSSLLQSDSRPTITVHQAAKTVRRLGELNQPASLNQLSYAYRLVEYR